MPYLIHLPSALHRDLKQASELSGDTMSRIIREAVRKSCDEILRVNDIDAPGFVPLGLRK